MSVRFCPVASCGCKVPATRVFCTRHWKTLTPTEKRVAFETWFRYSIAKIITAAEYTRAVGLILSRMAAGGRVSV